MRPINVVFFYFVVFLSNLKKFIWIAPSMGREVQRVFAWANHNKQPFRYTSTICCCWARRKTVYASTQYKVCPAHNAKMFEMKNKQLRPITANMKYVVTCKLLLYFGVHMYVCMYGVCFIIPERYSHVPHCNEYLLQVSKSSQFNWNGIFVPEPILCRLRTYIVAKEQIRVLKCLTIDLLSHQIH